MMRQVLENTDLSLGYPSLSEVRQRTFRVYPYCY
jgi:hypothetical protein